MSKGILYISFFLVFVSNAQNLKKTDSLVLNYSEIKNVTQLSNRIDSDFISEKEKIRATYSWIVNNIRYDNLYILPPKTFVATSQKDLKKQIKKYDLERANLVIKGKKAICNGYANLFNQICKKLEIKSEMISGFAKSEITDITSNFYNNHSWNKVYINNKAYLVDTTWGAGFFDNSTGFIKNVSYTYFLTNPNYFILNHYPENYKDSLLKRNISISEYLNFPIIQLRNYNGIRLIRPTSAIIKKEKDINLKFTFQVSKIIKNVSYYLGGKFYYVYNYRFKKNILSFEIDKDNYEYHDLIILINDKVICSYLIE